MTVSSTARPDVAFAISSATSLLAFLLMANSAVGDTAI